MAEEVAYALEEYIENENLLGNIAELDEVLCNLVDRNKSNERDLRRVVLCIYQLLDRHNKWQVKFGKKVFHKLTALLAKGQSRTTTALIVSCIKTYVHKFPKQQGQYLIEELWCLSTSNEEQPHAALILIQMFDYFVSVIDNFLYAKELHEVVRQLLVSELVEERKSAHQIMRKLLSAIEVNNNETRLIALGWSDKQQFLHSWSIYVAMWEQLELEPTAVELDNLKEMHHKGNSWWQAWLNLLQRKLLAHDNISLKRKALHYFMENYNFAELNESLQKQFLLAANNVELYNVDDTFFWLKSKACEDEIKYLLVPIYFKAFFRNAIIQFLEALGLIEWQSVPLHSWLMRVTGEIPKWLSISKESLLKLAVVVRQVKNKKIRNALRYRLVEVLKLSIDSLTLPEYVEFCETLYNIDDGYSDDHFLLYKLERMANLEGVLTCFSKRFYEIISNRFKTYDFDDFLCCSYKYFNSKFKRTIQRLGSVPKEQHGWLRFLIVFDVEHTDLVIEFCHNQYDLDLVRLSTASLSLGEFYSEIAKKLVWQPEDEVELIRKKCVDLYVEQRLNKWSDINELGLNPISLLSMGTCSTLAVLIKLLGNHDSKLPSNIISEIFETLKRTCLHRKDICGFFVRHVLAYANRNLTTAEVESLTHDILNVNSTHTELTYQVSWQAELSNETLIRGFLHGEPTTGIERIAEAYEEYLVHTIPNIMRLRHSFKFKDHGDCKVVYDELLRINGELTKRRPHYHENSKVHRLKMRIAQAILYLQDYYNSQYWSDELWTALLTDFDHDNIRYLHELMIVTFAPDLEKLLKKFRESTHRNASQQVSLMSVVFLYCMFNWTKVETSQLIVVLELLLPLTMGANFQTRLHAQLFSYCLILKAEENKIQLPHGANIKRSVVVACGNKLEEYLLQPRFNFPAFYRKSSSSISDMILYVTNAPFDECGYWFLRNTFNIDFQEYFDNIRKVYMQHAASRQSTYIVEADDINLNFGTIGSNLKSVDETLFGNSVARPHQNADIFVVASLIDKLPNLGGIARTCEVLGIKNLVMDSKLHVAKCDFQNLSLTAEKSLNILEIKPATLADFLIQKQIDGFKIVGAEQTANSVSFVDFQFPAKCVLLLGHEKHGIPAALLSLLDYAVEIPQFGLVRSLNVHVTGALFMWEYCKQHQLCV